MVSGTPNSATQVTRKASMQEAADKSFSGTASSHLVVLSMMVNMYRKPSFRSRERTHQVHVNMGESPCRDGYGLNRGPRLLARLSPLAGHTVPAPGRDISLHPRPNITGRKENFRSPNPGVSDTVDSLEDLPPILLRD
jgi:hypothetical protein